MRELVCSRCGIIVKVNNYRYGSGEYTCSICRGVVYEKKRKKKVEVVEENSE
jgi:transcription initiation factor TFIIIB Brf1 subunit/transcription initiation factor TFIIB